jgi:uncharacterized protein (DUF1499 family)
VETPSRVASSAAGLGIVGFALIVAVPVGTFVGLFGPGAFRLFTLGILLGLLALVVGAVALWITRPAAHRPGRERALTGASLGFVIVAGILLLLLTTGGAGVPPINDITTNIDDPPVFFHAPTLTGSAMDYEADTTAGPTRDAYADLVTIQLDAPPDRAFGRVERAAEELGWEISYRDPESGVLEAQQTSRIFKFVDDVVVRIRPAAGGSQVDVRSKSRLGRGDLGANAKRIRALRDAITR